MVLNSSSRADQSIDIEDKHQRNRNGHSMGASRERQLAAIFITCEKNRFSQTLLCVLLYHSRKIPYTGLSEEPLRNMHNSTTTDYFSCVGAGPISSSIWSAARIATFSWLQSENPQFTHFSLNLMADNRKWLDCVCSQNWLELEFAIPLRRKPNIRAQTHPNTDRRTPRISKYCEVCKDA